MRDLTRAAAFALGALLIIHCASEDGSGEDTTAGGDAASDSSKPADAAGTEASSDASSSHDATQDVQGIDASDASTADVSDGSTPSDASDASDASDGAHAADASDASDASIDSPVDAPSDGAIKTDASDASADANSDAADAGTPQSLSLNDGASCTVGAFGPGSTEDGYWVVVRVPDPSKHPFTVDALEYTLAHGGTTPCNAGLAHDVAVYKSTGTTPANGLPSVVTSVPALAGVTSQRLVQVNLANPVTVAAGEHIFAAIKLRYISGPQLLCVGQCYAAPDNFVTNANFYVNAARNAYTTVEALGSTFSHNFMIKAIGH